MPIKDTAFGSNITYDPSFEKYVSLSNGTFNNFTFSFRDQNFNEIYARDPNVSITLIIRQKNKMFSSIYNGQTSHSHRFRIQKTKLQK
jgi:hypothetical protein